MRNFLAALAVVFVVVLGVAAAAGQLPPRFGGASPGPSTVVGTPEQAAAIALAQDTRFADIGPRDPNLIGQGSWWEATATDGGYLVTIQIGWGDCPAGCIHRHTWVYSVDSNGAVALRSEEGEAVDTQTVP